MKDTDGDGFRELPNVEKIVLNMQFATQGISGKVVELVANHWSQVGVQTSVKEVTPDEYRSAQSANKLDVGMWKRGQPVAIVMGNNEMWVPPFGTYFEHRTGMLWAEWVSSNGANGVEPPAFVKAMMGDINAFQSATPGSAESAEIGSRLAATMTEIAVLEMMIMETVVAKMQAEQVSTVRARWKQVTSLSVMLYLQMC